MSWDNHQQNASGHELSTANQPPILFFLHIPKNGGTTLNSILDVNYSFDRFFQGYNTIDKFQSRAFFIEKFKQLPADRKNRIQVIRSHFYFGFHRELGIKQYRYICLLRDPVERYLSDFHFTRHNVHHILNRKTRQISFREYLSETDPQFRVSDNLQTRMIAGEPGPECTDATLRTAKENLEKHFYIVGTLDRFDHMLALLKYKNILHHTGYVKQNPTRKRLGKDELSPHDRTVVEEKNAYDIQLYRFASELAEKRFRDAGPGLLEILEQVRKDNRVNENHHFFAGYRAFQQNRWDESKDHLVRCLESLATVDGFSEIKARAGFYLGEIHRAENKEKEAERYYRHSLDVLLSADRLGVNNTYLTGSIFQRLNDFHNSRLWFHKITPHFLSRSLIGNAYFHLGQVELAAGDLEKAVRMFKTTLEYSPIHGAAIRQLKKLDPSNQ